MGRRRYWSLFGLISWTHILVLAIVHVILVLLELVDLLQLICFGFKNIYYVQNLSCLMEVIVITILGSVFSSSAMICFLHKPSVLLCDQSAFTDLTTYWNGRNGKLRNTQRNLTAPTHLLLLPEAPVPNPGIPLRHVPEAPKLKKTWVKKQGPITDSRTSLDRWLRLLFTNN
jgi:hypothetical protein